MLSNISGTMSWFGSESTDSSSENAIPDVDSIRGESFVLLVWDMLVGDQEMTMHVALAVVGFDGTSHVTLVGHRHALFSIHQGKVLFDSKF